MRTGRALSSSASVRPTMSPIRRLPSASPWPGPPIAARTAGVRLSKVTSWLASLPSERRIWPSAVMISSVVRGEVWNSMSTQLRRERPPRVGDLPSGEAVSRLIAGRVGHEALRKFDFSCSSRVAVVIVRGEWSVSRGRS